MHNTVELYFNGVKLDYWKSVSVASDLYRADSNMKLVTTVANVNIPDYAKFELRINDSRVMTGLMTGIDENAGKANRQVTFIGRDYMGLLIDEYIETFKTYEQTSLRTVAEEILAPIDYVSRKNIVFKNGSERTLVPNQFLHLSPGQTVFEILSGIAFSRGLLMYCNADGAIVFTKPPRKDIKPLFNLSRTRTARNIKSGSRNRDLSKWYRKVIVIGQQQGEDSFDDDEVNVIGTKIDSTHPLKHKTFVTQVNADGISGSNHAALIMQKQKLEANSYTYTTAGFAQGGELWRINELCSVADDEFSLYEPLMVSGREFTQSKEAGSNTVIKLGGIPE